MFYHKSSLIAFIPFWYPNQQPAISIYDRPHFGFFFADPKKIFHPPHVGRWLEIFLLCFMIWNLDFIFIWLKFLHHVFYISKKFTLNYNSLTFLCKSQANEFETVKDGSSLPNYSHLQACFCETKSSPMKNSPSTARYFTGIPRIQSIRTLHFRQDFPAILRHCSRCPDTLPLFFCNSIAPCRKWIWVSRTDLSPFPPKPSLRSPSAWPSWGGLCPVDPSRGTWQERRKSEVGWVDNALETAAGSIASCWEVGGIAALISGCSSFDQMPCSSHWMDLLKPAASGLHSAMRDRHGEKYFKTSRKWTCPNKLDHLDFTIQTLF